MIKLSDYVMKFVENLGVKDVFYLSGGGCMHLVDSLGKNSSLNKIANLHEQCATIGASGYSQYTNNIGVALVTTGPGGTNAITGVAAAWIDSVPMFVLSGQVKRADLIGSRKVRQMGPQEVDIISIVKPITKYAVTVMDPMEIRYILEEALFYAKEGRKGPVWIDIPIDVQGAVIDEELLRGFSNPETNQLQNIDVKKLYHLINQAERPVLLIGNGVRLSGAEEKVVELATQLQFPVQTTWKSLDIIEETHPLYFGRPGAIAQRGANFIQQNADLFISIGARLDLGQVAFDYKALARGAKKVVVDIDPYEIDKIDTEIEMKICADALIFIQTMLENIELYKGKNCSEWLKKCSEWKDKYPVVLEEYRGLVTKVNSYVLFEALSDLLGENDIIVPGSSGSCSEIASQSFKLKKGQRFINSPGLGSMGFGVAESIGVCIASGKKRTICIIGDGGLQHNIQELQLLKRYNLPIKVFVLNNNAYGSIRAMQNRIFNGHLVGCDDSSGVTLPDTIAIASAYGIANYCIKNQFDLLSQVEKVLVEPGPVICEVMIDTEMQIAPRTSSMVKEDGQIMSMPLEDLWPFLSREEFNDNMIIQPLERG